MPKKTKDPGAIFAGDKSQSKAPKTKTAKPKKPKKPRGVTASTSIRSTKNPYTAIAGKKTSTKPRKPRTKKPKTDKPKYENPLKSYKGLYEQQFKRVSKYLSQGIEEGLISQEKAQQFLNDKALFKTKQEYEKLKSLTKKRVYQEFASEQGLEQFRLSKEYNELRAEIQKIFRQAKKKGYFDEGTKLTDIIGKKPKYVTQSTIDLLKYELSVMQTPQPQPPKEPTAPLEPKPNQTTPQIPEQPEDPYQSPQSYYSDYWEDDDELPTEQRMVLTNLEKLLTDEWATDQSSDSYWYGIIREKQTKLAGALEHFIEMDGEKAIAERCQNSPDIIADATAFLLSSQRDETDANYNRVLEILRGGKLDPQFMEEIEPTHFSKEGY